MLSVRSVLQVLSGSAQRGSRAGCGGHGVLEPCGPEDAGWVRGSAVPCRPEGVRWARVGFSVSARESTSLGCAVTAEVRVAVPGVPRRVGMSVGTRVGHVCSSCPGTRGHGWAGGLGPRGCPARGPSTAGGTDSAVPASLAARDREKMSSPHPGECPWVGLGQPWGCLRCQAAPCPRPLPLPASRKPGRAGGQERPTAAGALQLQQSRVAAPQP